MSTRPNAASTTIWCTDRKSPLRCFACRSQRRHWVRDASIRARRRMERGPLVMDLFPGCRGAMHRTDTLDYVIVMEGEVEMQLDNWSHRAARRRYSSCSRGPFTPGTNPTDQHARLAIVLVDAHPLGDGFPPARSSRLSSARPSRMIAAAEIGSKSSFQRYRNRAAAVAR